MRSLQHFDAKLEIKSMAGNLYPLVLMIMVNMVYIMITLANDGDEGDDGADDDCRITARHTAVNQGGFHSMKYETKTSWDARS